MPTMPVPFNDVLDTVAAYHQAIDDGYEPSPTGGYRSAMAEAAERLGLNLNNGRVYVSKRLDTATALGVQVRSWRAVDPDFANKTLLRYRTYDEEYRAAKTRLTRPVKAPPGTPRAGSLPGGQRARGTPQPTMSTPPAPGRPAGIDRATESKAAVKAARQPTTVVTATAAEPARLTMKELAAKIVPMLRRGPMHIDILSEKLETDKVTAHGVVDIAVSDGANIYFRNGEFHLDDAPAVGGAGRADDLVFTTDPDGTFTFAISTDQHLCSKYESLDELNEFYDQVQKRGISVVLNAGNWCDGEAVFNRHELLVHGCDAQLAYLAANYPSRDGVTTYAIAGADHEGWYSRREGVDIGRYAENVMRQNGRTDWFDIGYVERAVPLQHHASGEGSNILIMHPGGGSAYATSYIPQKIVESFSAGEKPGALVLGHYHKADYTYMRDVHVMQGGCFQRQSLFMRSKRLSAHLGGCFVKLTVDPKTGAFIECQYTFRNYFDKAYHNGRWSQSGPVTKVPLSTGPR